MAAPSAPLRKILSPPFLAGSGVSRCCTAPWRNRHRAPPITSFVRSSHGTAAPFCTVPAVASGPYKRSRRNHHRQYHRHHRGGPCVPSAMCRDGRTVRTRGFGTTTDTKPHYDIVIVGGGAVGSTLAKLLSTALPSVTIALLDSRTPKPGGAALAKDGDAVPNARAYAISPKNLGLVGGDVIERLRGAGRIAFYDSMQIWESNGPATLHFNHGDIPPPSKSNSSSTVDNNTNNSTPLTDNILGAVIEDGPLVSCLWDTLRTSAPNVDLLSPATVSHILQPTPGSSDPIELTYRQKDATADTSVTANLLVAADGANSRIRTEIGTFPTVRIGYDRTAVTCTVRLDDGTATMDRTAFQRFEPNGPIALLPVWSDDPTRPTYANVVWSTTPSHARHLLSLPPSGFLSALNTHLRSGPRTTPPLLPPFLTRHLPRPIGDAVRGVEHLAQSVNVGLSMAGWTERGTVFRVPPVVGGVVGERFGIPLNLEHAGRYAGDRVVLVGDAAHTIHPMAGQGLNLGLADAQVLTAHLTQTVRSGAGLRTTSGLQYALSQYESERQREVLATMGGIQALHAVFSTEVGVGVYLRSLGLNLVNSVGGVRRFLAGVAVGDRGIF